MNALSLPFELLLTAMKTTIGVLFFLFSVATFAQSGSFLDRTKLALKAGNAKGLSVLFAPSVQLGFEGEANVVSLKEAEVQLNKFFKANFPTQLEPLFQGLGKDGKQYFIGKMSCKSASYRVSVYWVEVPTPAIQSVDFSKE